MNRTEICRHKEKQRSYVMQSERTRPLEVRIRESLVGFTWQMELTESTAQRQSPSRKIQRNQAFADQTEKQMCWGRKLFETL